MRRIVFALILAAAVVIHACAVARRQTEHGRRASSAVSVQLFTTDANPAEPARWSRPSSR
jgi:hypothetical protein